MSSSDTENIINIINAVKSHECLWNVHSPEYAKRDKLEKAWTEVAREVGRSDMHCREKWRNVRTGFLRSIQNSIRIVTDECSNDLLAVRKKRFYLYDYMSFLLPSAETLGEARKRKRQSKVHYKDDGNNDCTSDDTMQAYTLIGKYEDNCETYNAVEEDSIEQVSSATQEVNTNYAQLVMKDAPDPNLGAAGVAKIGNNLPQKNEATTLSNTDILASIPRDETIPELHNRGYDSRDVEQLIDFFKGNIDDILSLTKKNQRLFKRKMLKLIEELHDTEDLLE